MQRGTVSLTPEEAGLALQLVVADELPELLRVKLAGIRAGGESQLFSQDELESLLDLLPPPGVGDDVILKSLRKKISAFFNHS